MRHWLRSQGAATNTETYHNYGEGELEMRVVKMVQAGKVKFVEPVKQGTVQFDSRPGWLYVREVDKRPVRAEAWWVHPSEVWFEWDREFA